MRGSIPRTVTMGRFNDMLKSLDEIRNNVMNILDTSIERERSSFILLNQQQLYNKGEMSDGKLLPPYTYFTTISKRESPSGHDKKTSNMTLKDTSEFYQEMYININPEDVQMLSRGKNTASLIERFGMNIMGLTDESLDYVKPKIKDHMIEISKQILKI